MHAVGRAAAPLIAPIIGAAVAGAATLAWHDLHAPLAAILAALFIGAFVPFAVDELRSVGVGSPALLFVVGLAYYHLIIPVEYLIDPDLPVGFVHEYGAITTAELVAPLVATDCALFAFVAGYAWLRRSPEPPATAAPPMPIDDRRLTIASIAFAAVGAAMYLAMSFTTTGSLFGIFSVSYRDRNELSFGLGSLGLGLQFVYLGLSALGILWLGRGGAARTAGAVAIAAFMGLQSFLLGGKMYGFQVGVSLLVGGWFFGRRLQPKTAAVLAVVLAFPLLFVGLTRNRLGQGLDEMAAYAVDEAEADSFNPANLDAYGPYLTLIYTTSTVQVPRDLRWGATYLECVTLLPPLWIYPSRPLSVADEFAKDYLGKDYYDNAGFGYSAVTEAYANFGIGGELGVFFLFGLAFRAFASWIARRRGQLAAAIIVGTAAPTALLAVRYPFSTLIKGYGLMMLLPALVLLRLAQPSRKP